MFGNPIISASDRVYRIQNDYNQELVFPVWMVGLRDNTMEGISGRTWIYLLGKEQFLSPMTIQEILDSAFVPGKP